MGQIQGQTGNPYGRPRGAKNKKNSQIKLKIEEFTNEHFDSFINSYNAIEKPIDKVRIYLEVAKLILPRPKDESDDDAGDFRKSELIKRLFPPRENTI